MSNLQSNKLADTQAHGLSLTMLMRKYEDNGESYFVAECPEIPGCVADGNTEDAAAEHLNAAIQTCVEVLFEDCLKAAAAGAAPDMDYVGITSQRTVQLVLPELRVA